jgi:hypothetical protein
MVTIFTSAYLRGKTPGGQQPQFLFADTNQGSSYQSKDGKVLKKRFIITI